MLTSLPPAKKSTVNERKEHNVKNTF